MHSSQEGQPPVCICCGQPSIDDGWMILGTVRADGHWRCKTHMDRNPCVIEGCSKTRMSKGRFSADDVICSVHWRAYVPPRSKRRLAYHRFWRIAKKTDWTDGLERRYFRFWYGLVKVIRRESQAGRMDVDEIHKLFGWDQ